MLTRRGFFGRVTGALAAAVVAPKALFARQPLTTLGLNDGLGTYRYKYTFVTSAGETPVTPPPPQVIKRTMWITSSDGVYRQIPIPDGATYMIDNGRNGVTFH